MDPLLNSVYGAVLPAAPYVIAAYALIWIVLFIYVVIVVRGLKKNQADLELLEHEIERLSADAEQSSRVSGYTNV